MFMCQEYFQTDQRMQFKINRPVRNKIYAKVHKSTKIRKLGATEQHRVVQQIWITQPLDLLWTDSLNQDMKILLMCVILQVVITLSLNCVAVVKKMQLNSN